VDFASFVAAYGTFIATTVLVAATFVLAWHSSRLVSVTRELRDATSKLGRIETIPVLDFEAQQPLSDSGDKTTLRFSVMSKGRGAARLTGVTAKYQDGSLAMVIPLDRGHVYLPGQIGYFDVRNVSLDEKISIHLEYEDIQGNRCQPLEKTILVY